MDVLEVIKSNSTEAKPFIKCPGGKRRLLDSIVANLPEDFAETIKLYVEPFVGGGAVFFKLHQMYPELNSVINDYNKDIANTYQVISDPKKCKDLVGSLELYSNAGGDRKDNFYYIRELFNLKKEKTSAVGLAAKFIYLNKMCFNGLIRYNKKGQFNSPCGSNDQKKVYTPDNIWAAHGVLSSPTVKEISCCDFSRVIWNCLYNQKCDPSEVFIYCDPPYDVLNETSNFVSYTMDGFTKTDHLRLKNDLDAVDNAGGRFLLSAADTSLMRELFGNYPLYEVRAGRSINSNTKKRGKITELLIRNY